MRKFLTGLALILATTFTSGEAIAEKKSPKFGIEVAGEARYKLEKARDWEDSDLPDFVRHPFPAAAGPRVTLHYGPLRTSIFYGDTKTAKDIVPQLNLGARFHEVRERGEEINLPGENNFFSCDGRLEAIGNWEVSDDARSFTVGANKSFELTNRVSLNLDGEVDFYSYEMRASAMGNLYGNVNWQARVEDRTFNGTFNGEQNFETHVDINQNGVNFNFTPMLKVNSPIGDFSAGPIFSERNTWTGYKMSIMGQDLELPEDLSLGKYKTTFDVGGDFRYENHGFKIGLKLNTGYGDSATIGYTKKFGGKPETKPVKITKSFLRKAA